MIHSTKWSIIGAGLVQSMGLLSGIIVARVIGKVGFGQYGIIQSTIGMFGVFAGLALGITATKHIAEFRDIDPLRAGRFIGLPVSIGLFSSLLVSVFLFVFADSISEKILGNYNLVSALRLGVPLLIFNTVSNVQMAAFAGLESFRPLAYGNFVVGILTLLFISVGVLLWSLNGAVGGLMFSRLFACIIFEVVLRKCCRDKGIVISYRGVRREWPILWNFSVPTFLAGMIIGPASWLCNILLVNQPNGYAEMGIYNATLQWQSAVQFIPLRVLSVTLPVLSNLYGQKDFRRYYRAIRGSISAVSGIALLISVPIIVMSKLIMHSYGKDFIGGSIVLIVMIIAVYLQILARLLSQVAQSRGKAWVDFSFCSLRSVVLILAWLLILSKGAKGLALAICVSYLIINLGLIVYLLYVRSTDKKFLKDD
ncbi:MAG: oligosaccharide flippase family protein [Planctomycetota bacterium]